MNRVRAWSLVKSFLGAVLFLLVFVVLWHGPAWLWLVKAPFSEQVRLLGFGVWFLGFPIMAMAYSVYITIVSRRKYEQSIRAD